MSRYRKLFTSQYTGCGVKVCLVKDTCFFFFKNEDIGKLSIWERGWDSLAR